MLNRSIKTSQGPYFLWIITLICILVLIIRVSPAAATSDIKLVLNDTQVESTAATYIDSNGYTMVPLRFVMEYMDADDNWQPIDKTVVIIRGKTTLKMEIGCSQVYVNGREVLLDTRPVIRENFTMVPVRFVSQAFGGRVAWDSFSRTVSIHLQKPQKTIDLLRIVCQEGNYVNVRSGPALSYGIVGKLYRGTLVDLLGAMGEWYQIQLNGGGVGWVSKNYTELVSNEGRLSSEQPSSEQPSQVGITCKEGNYVNLREGPGLSYDIFDRLYRGTKLNLLGVTEGWYQVQLSNGRTGWVSKEYAELIGDDISLNDGRPDSYLPSADVLRDWPKPTAITDCRIVIDPGHGTDPEGVEPGAIGPCGTKEKDVNLAVSLELAQLLRTAGATVYLTRSSETTPYTLAERAYYANDVKGHIFISIHANGSTSPDKSGTSTYFFAPYNSDLGVQRKERQQLANSIQRALLIALGRKDMGVKEDNFSVLRNTAMPSVLVEVAFITNPTEEELLNDPVFQVEAAQGIFKGINEYISGI